MPLTLEACVNSPVKPRLSANRRAEPAMTLLSSPLEVSRQPAKPRRASPKAIP
jgi:hypothetical protein